MRNILYYRIIFFIVILPLIAEAGLQETIPTYHWSYHTIAALQSRGYLLELSLLQLPYSRREVAKGLISISLNTESMDKWSHSAYNRLCREFKEEIEQIENQNAKADQLVFRAHIRAYLDDPLDQSIVYRGIYRGGAGFQVGKHLFAYSGVNSDQYDYHDPLYVGRKWRGITGYTEQAYVHAEFDAFSLKFGRDFLRWGVGESGTLVLSNQSRPLDQIQANTLFGPFRFTFFASELDAFSTTDTLLGSVHVRRFLSGHRLDFRLFGGRLQASASEVIIYGGPNSNFNFVYLNPLLFFHLDKKNGAGENNVLPSFDIVVYPIKHLKLYGSLLIDDIQIEKTGPGDLEPNEIAWLAGVNWSDPFGFYGFDVFTEYVMVANRTYKTPFYWEIFTHRNKPLGHPLGSDFDHWQMGCSKWFGSMFWFRVQYALTRFGEGNLFSPYDEPWMDYTVDEGYSEPFPTGIVETSQELNISIKFYPSIHWGVEGEFMYQTLKNKDNIDGLSDDGFAWKIGLWCDGDLKIKF